MLFIEELILCITEYGGPLKSAFPEKLQYFDCFSLSYLNHFELILVSTEKSMAERFFFPLFKSVVQKMVSLILISIGFFLGKGLTFQDQDELTKRRGNKEFRCLKLIPDCKTEFLTEGCCYRLPQRVEIRNLILLHLLEPSCSLSRRRGEAMPRPVWHEKQRAWKPFIA